jgi:hypothetical protein
MTSQSPSNISFALTHIRKGIARFTRKAPDRTCALAAPFGSLGGQTIDEQRRRTRRLEALYRQHVVEVAGVDGVVTYTSTLPPAWWINEKLEAQGECWRVQNVDGYRCEAYDVR